MIRAITGGNWGDEGKGKMTDLLAADARYVVRFQGGANAGHTIINPYGRFALHLLPSGVFRAGVTNIIAQGVAMNLQKLKDELEDLLARGVPAPDLKISQRAQLLLPWHMLQDTLEEARLGTQCFGSTQNGIAPFYADKYLKTGIQLSELWDEKGFAGRIRRICADKNQMFQAIYQHPGLDAESVLETLLSYREWLFPMVTDTTTLLHRASAAGEHILLEGQLGALKDPDNGIYPYTTSSSTLAGCASAGAGVPPHAIGQILTVVKAYASCVGAGPFVTEIHGEEADTLRRLGGDCGEYGATTGRPRRMGWFDAVATRYGCMLQGTTEVALTLLDVLGYLPEIPVCTAYETDSGRTEDFPVTHRLSEARPVYTMLPGWQCDIRGIRQFAALPAAAQHYVRFIEKQIQCPVRWISTGPDRNDLIRPEP